MARKAVLNGKSLIYPKEYNTLAEMIVYIAQKYPHKGIRYIDAAGREELVCYQELVDNARKCLKRLYENGIRPGDKLILEIDNSKEFYNVFWACILGGIIAAPVTQPASWEPGSTGLLKLTRVWEILDRPVIIIEKQNHKHYKLLQGCEEYGELKVISTDELVCGDMEEIFPTKPEDLVFLQFSSGSTGIPKGVKLTNRNILTNIIALSNRFEATENDIAFTWLPHTHDMGLFAQHMTPIVNGCNIMKFSPFTFVRSPYMFLKKLTEHKGTWFASPNFGYAWMTEKIPDEKLSSLDLSSLRFVLNGAEPISTAVNNTFAEKFSKCGFRKNMMLPGYGMAEATVAVCISIVGELPKVHSISRTKMINENIAVPVEDDNDADKIEFVQEGGPIQNINVRIADDSGRTLDEGMIGEIQIKGESVTEGYYNCDDITSRMYVDGWLRTGDLGFIADNSLVVSGRIKDIIFIRGQNYFAHDLEEIIYELGTIPRGNIAVAGLFSGKTRQEELLVFIKYKLDIEKFLPLRQSIVDKLNETLGVQVTHVIPIKLIPKTTSGKVQRFQLCNYYESGVYDTLLNEIQAGIDKCGEGERIVSLPQNELEIFLHKSWSELLNIPPQRISIDDSFSKLGGNSVKAYQLLDAIEKHLKREIGPEVLVLCKTIREISEYLQSRADCGGKKTSDLRPENSSEDNRAIAVTGIAVRLPGAKNHRIFWDNLYNGRDSIAKVSARRKQLCGGTQWDEWMGELEDIDMFDNDFFEMSPEEAMVTDPQQRLALEASYEALEDAGAVPGMEEERNVGVYAGISSNTYLNLLIKHIEKNGIDKVHHNAMVGNMPNIIAAAISHKYNFTGPAMAIDTACSSFSAAVCHAASALTNNSISGAVVAGANILADPSIHVLARNAGIISSTKYSKVFDKDADGSVLGEGVVVVYLEPLDTAVRDSKNIYGVIRGAAVNNDGYSLGIMAPNPQGQFKVIEDAYMNAGVSPDEIGYIEVHGTGTAIGDPIEINALSKLFSKHGKDTPRHIGIGSVKTNIGHLLPAAGGAGLVKVLLCLKNKKLVPTLHTENVNSALQLEKTPLYIVKEAGDWPARESGTRKAGISSFGLGGTNTHIVLEEWREEPAAASGSKLQILTMSAKSEGALESIISQTEDMLKNTPDMDINNLCFTRNRYRRHYGYRAACIVSSGGSTGSLSAVSKGSFLKNRPARVCIIIGDIKECITKNVAAYGGEQGRVPEQNLPELYDSVNRHNIMALEGYDGKELSFFAYWYWLAREIKHAGADILNISGMGSGQIAADVLNNEIDWAAALEEYFAGGNTGKKESRGDNENQALGQSLKKADIVLGLCIAEDDCTKMLPEGLGDKLKILVAQPAEGGCFDSGLLSVIRDLYAAGADFDWKSIHPDGSGRVVSLPPYPFEKKSFWIDQLRGE
ncbi:phosphopantetheine binding protein [Anaerobacterium chartisolvens]|uniref:Phosphopantetheine binding protein n=1 Tax=Anaerobacterium chartisolvens TaxID=1297424 RepID=A0A369BE45_9FIRM|nr:beta-ketoacyl synthase N-terminal-like domain-containing protein [Anaerobacterium chartisolvens]RCX18747.1 phosphopantetheine binding protein [Anaerobacterium chartisolvens]